MHRGDRTSPRAPATLLKEMRPLRCTPVRVGRRAALLEEVVHLPWAQGGATALEVRGSAVRHLEEGMDGGGREETRVQVWRAGVAGVQQRRAEVKFGGGFCFGDLP